VALASQGEWAERVGVTQATPIQNSQLTSKTKAMAALANLPQMLVWVFFVSPHLPLVSVFFHLLLH